MDIPPPSIGIRYLLERLAKAEHMNAVLLEQLEMLRAQKPKAPSSDEGEAGTPT